MSKKSERSKKKVSVLFLLHAGRPSMQKHLLWKNHSVVNALHMARELKRLQVFQLLFLMSCWKDSLLFPVSKLSPKLVGTMGLVLVQQQASAQYYQTIQERERESKLKTSTSGLFEHCYC